MPVPAVERAVPAIASGHDRGRQPAEHLERSGDVLRDGHAREPPRRIPNGRRCARPAGAVVIALISAAHRRAAARAERDESGFILIYVMLITTIITIAVAGTVVVTSANVVPSVRTAFAQAAEAAAQGGINAFVNYADANCSGSDSSVSTCTLPTNFSGVVPFYSGSGYTASYAWKADKDPANRYFRVTATGTTAQGGITVSRTLKADIAGGASTNVLDYGVVTGYETQS